MEDKQNYQDDLHHIRDIMERSSRFLSLSGLSGVMAGSYALAGAVLAYFVIHDKYGTMSVSARWSSDFFGPPMELMLIAFVVLVLALSTGLWLSMRRARRLGVKFFGPTANRLLINLAIPLGTGGLFVAMITYQGYYGLAAPLMLIFYGLTLLNASKYTLPDIRSLGIAEIILGLLNTLYIGYGLYFWAVGFGALHIIYGLAMYQKYER